jgi:hypothetical protein
MALEQTNANIAFANGNWTSATKDSNGFWISIGTYNSSANIEANETTIDISDLTLNHNSSGMFSSYTLSVYLRAEYTYGGQLFYKYFFGDSNGTTVGQKTMSSTSLSLLTSTQIASVTIPHNLDGTRTDLVIRGFVDAPTNASYVPENTLAYSNPVTLPRIPRGPRVKDAGVWKNTVLYVKDAGVWKIAIPYVKDNGTWKIGGG